MILHFHLNTPPKKKQKNNNNNNNNTHTHTQTQQQQQQHLCLTETGSLTNNLGPRMVTVQCIKFVFVFRGSSYTDNSTPFDRSLPSAMTIPMSERPQVLTMPYICFEHCLPVVLLDFVRLLALFSVVLLTCLFLRCLFCCLDFLDSLGGTAQVGFPNVFASVLLENCFLFCFVLFVCLFVCYSVYDFKPQVSWPRFSQPVLNKVYEECWENWDLQRLQGNLP